MAANMPHSCNGMINEMINEGGGRANAMASAGAENCATLFAASNQWHLYRGDFIPKCPTTSDSLTGWTVGQSDSSTGEQWTQWDELAHQCNQLRHGEQQQELNLAHEKRFNNTN